jgi:hypothetical protein
MIYFLIRICKQVVLITYKECGILHLISEVLQQGGSGV